MKMPIEEFYNMTMEEYLCKSKGHMLAEMKEWDRIRTIGYFQFLAAGAKIRSPKDVMKLPLIDGDEHENKIRPSLMKKLMEAKLRDGQSTDTSSTQDTSGDPIG